MTARSSAGGHPRITSYNVCYTKLLRVWDLLALVLVVISGIALGWLTPTEAASIGAVGALILCQRRRQLNLRVLRSALQDTLVTSGLIFAVIIGSLIFSVFISVRNNFV